VTLIDLAQGIRGHRAFGRQSARAVQLYNTHLAEANEFACLIERDVLLIEPLGWALLCARGGDPRLTDEPDRIDDELMRDCLELGWTRLEEGQEGYDLLHSALQGQCQRRRIDAPSGPLVFWLAPDGDEMAAIRLQRPTQDTVNMALGMELADLRATGVDPAGVGVTWYLRHPETGACAPALAVWNRALALVAEQLAEQSTTPAPAPAPTLTDALRALNRLGFSPIGPSQPASEIAETLKSAEHLPATIDLAVRQISRDEQECDPELRAQSERQYRQRDGGRLCCQGCGIDFVQTYGARGEGMMHFHNPGTCTEGTPPLVALCPNCHAITHRGQTVLPLADLRALLGR